jgi:ABC-type proline/glycine betaine transport system substrate-binding protein
MRKKILALAAALALVTVPVFAQGGAAPPPEGTVGVVTYQIQNGQAVQVGEVQVVLPISPVCLPDEAA